MTIIVPDSATAHLQTQRTNKGLTNKQRAQQVVAEFAVLPSILPKPPKSILDLGCGVGIGLVVLSKLFPDARLAGVDGSGPVAKIGGYMPVSKQPWNSLMVTQELLMANGVKATLYDISEQITEQFDLVVSTHAAGYHWPIEAEAKRLKDVGAAYVWYDERVGSVSKLSGTVINKIVPNHKRNRLLVELR